MKFLKINADKHNTLSIVKMDPNLDNKEKLQFYYNNIHCNYIDMLSIKINNTCYDIIFDDEGKLNSNKITSLAFIHDNKIIDFIVGDILFCKSNEDGETIGLKDIDIKNIIEYLTTCKQILDFKNQKLTFTLEI